MKKETIGVIIFIIIMSVILIYGINRIEKINNGEMTIVNQNEMDR